MTTTPDYQNGLPKQLHQKLHEALASLKFGTITLVVQDGRVIQLDRHEKFRLSGLYGLNGEGI
jgi:hypothetical protein